MFKQIDNIRWVLDSADQIDTEEGLTAYPRYRVLMQKLAAYWHRDLDEVVGCFSATSPNNDYVKNLRSAVSLIAGHNRKKKLRNVTVSTYRKAAERAWRVLEGEHFMSFTKGLKTRAFFTNITDPANPLPATIDGHMLGIWYGSYLTMTQAAILMRNHKHWYEEIEEGVRVVAQERGLLPNQVQAICWFRWKCINKPVIHDGQLHLYRPGDHWGLNLRPRDIKPFIHRKVSIHQQRELDRIAREKAMQNAPAQPVLFFNGGLPY